jgi:hypothetical protein
LRCQCLLETLLHDDSSLLLGQHYDAMRNVKDQPVQIPKKKPRRRRHASVADWLSPEDQEDERRSVPPYLLPDQILSILRFRAEFESDAQAREFLRSHGGQGFFSRLGQLF